MDGSEKVIWGTVIFYIISLPFCLIIGQNHHEKELINGISEPKKNEFMAKHDSTFLAAFDSLSVLKTNYENNISNAFYIANKKLVNEFTKKQDEAEYYFIDSYNKKMKSAATDTISHLYIAPYEKPVTEYTTRYKPAFPDSLRARLKAARHR